MVVKYPQSTIKTKCIKVSKRLPFHSFDEYPKNWISNRIPQKTARPKEIFFPKEVLVSSFAEVKQSSPIKNTTKAIKKVCTCIIWRLIRLKGARSFFHKKYLGKMT